MAYNCMIKHCTCVYVYACVVLYAWSICMCVCMLFHAKREKERGKPYAMQRACMMRYIYCIELGGVFHCENCECAFLSAACECCLLSAAFPLSTCMISFSFLYMCLLLFCCYFVVVCFCFALKKKTFVYFTKYDTCKTPHICGGPIL